MVLKMFRMTSPRLLDTLGPGKIHQDPAGPGRTRQLSRQKPMIGSLSPFNGIVQQLLIYYVDQGVQCYSLRVNHGFVEQSL